MVMKGMKCMEHFPLVILINYIKELKEKNSTLTFEEFNLEMREAFREKIAFMNDETIKDLYNSYYNK
jgi:FtsZ-binding cell division protein ZapB